MTRTGQPELLLALHLTELGVTFERQYAYVPGRRFRADFGLVADRLLIEVQGGIFTGQAHGSIRGVLADIERGNLATLHGWRRLCFTPQQVETGEAKAFIEAVLERG